MTVTDDDGKVTLAVISNQIENIQGDVTTIKGDIASSNVKLNDLTVKTAVIEEGQKNFGKEIDALQQKSNRNDVFVVVGNMIVVAVGSVATFFGLRE